jgi:hypothetical protein
LGDKGHRSARLPNGPTPVLRPEGKSANFRDASFLRFASGEDKNIGGKGGQRFVPEPFLAQLLDNGQMQRTGNDFPSGAHQGDMALKVSPTVVSIRLLASERLNKLSGLSPEFLQSKKVFPPFNINLIV